MSQLKTLLRVLYDSDTVDALAERIERRMSYTSVPSNHCSEGWSPSDMVLIAYPDAVRGGGEPPLQNLQRFLSDRLPGLFSQVHLLPFFPYTSDDGFSVSDYRQVDAQHGTWFDIKALSEDVGLVFDLVINHASSEHPYFQDFLRDRGPGNRYFLTADGNPDLSQVTRPRASPLLQVYDTRAGPKNVWCTFSRDQVDWDFSNPDVLYEFVDIFVSYIERGASWVRVDAIAFLWKEIGTTCVHLPQTHAVVKVLRWVADQVCPGFKILTETNVPLAENLSYFGEGDEAHIVYNFPLPPLLTHALLTGSGQMLSEWCQSLPALPEGCTYLNFTASHDGIGLRPAEGILDEEALAQLIGCVKQFGGRLTQRQMPDGSQRPYEANISLFDALRGTVDGEDEWQVERFLLCQCLMMSLAGGPALYYNSILAAPNNLEGLAETGRNRTINRKKWTLAEIDAHLFQEEGESPAQRVLDGIREMVTIRRAQPAFHPEAEQVCHAVDDRLFVLRRRAPSQHVLCIFNLSAQPVTFRKDDVGLQADASPEACFRQGAFENSSDAFFASPYAVAWFVIE